ncbi:unnamed protein product [Phyllotreta striolata]|uniref:Protein polybromo-1 n=1 Tax=Phyllotreta striolata TaxID=444603 RepID=A0A9P0GRC9_PHYSR|nr:unnamed protein product [Phyllotreta striolata]
MSKRRRPCSLPVYAEEDSLDGDEASTSGGPPANKRRKLFDPIEICQQLVELLRNRKKPDGTLLSESFIRIPKRRQEPAYYDVVSNPIDLIKVQQKLKMDEYEDVEDLQADVELMVDNAKAFYKRNTQEYKDAVELLELFYSNKNRLLQEPATKKPIPNNKRRSNNNNNNGTKTPSPRPPDRRPLRNKPKTPYTPNNTTRRRKLVERTPSSSSASSSEEEEEEEEEEENEESSERDTDGESASDEEDDSCPFEELMEAVMEARDEHRKLLHPPFQLLPSRKKYPDYYEVVEQPVDLKMVTNKITRGRYKFLFELEKDLLLMCKNACLYNEPGSQIYKQAKALRKFVQAKRVEIDTRRGTLPIMATPNSRNNTNKTAGSNRTSLNSSRTGSNSRSFKSSRSPSVTRSASVTPVSLAAGRNSLNSRHNSSLNRGAGVRVYRNNNRSSATPSPAPSPLRERDGFNLRNKRTPRSFKDQDSDFELDQDEFYDPSDPHWRLFETVRSATGYNGTMMSEPFRRLPSRKSYPDYYKEIKNPICLDQIRRKLVKKGYGNLSELAGDLTIMFENAKKYNVPTSKLYKDAVKLQKLMQTKVEELLDVDQLFTEKELIRRKPGPKPKYTSPMPRGRPPKDPALVKKRLHMLAKYMLDYTTEDGRKPMLAFIEKPSRKLYPAYYDVIAEPIDFLEIERKIKSEQYANVGELVDDFRLMFANCRQFNEENSPIYEDANLLERYLLDEVETWKRGNSSGRTADRQRRERVVLKPYKPRRIISPLEKSLKQLYESIRYYRHPTDDRLLSPAFMKLPSKLDYPDYYEVIPNPIDLDRIDRKNKAGEYQSIDDMATDLALLLDNACRYNEPGSQLYKDALTLRRQLFNTKMQLQLKEDENAVPDVAFIVQDVLLTLFANVYGYQDERGRCCSDSMADLPEHDIIEGVRTRALSLDLIKRRLDKGLYKRLDAFQEDFFACMERARRLSRTDSQVFQDAVELQLYFIKQRDELCNNGDLLSSPALIYTEIDAKASIDDIRAEKAMKESLSLIDEEEPDTPSRSSSENSILIGQKDEESNTNPISTNKDDENSVESSIVSMESVRNEESNTSKKGSEDNNTKQAESKVENNANNTKECESKNKEENANDDKECEKSVDIKETEENSSTNKINSVEEPEKSKNQECNGSNSSESSVLLATNKDDALVNKDSKSPPPGGVVSEPSELPSEQSSNNSDQVDYRIGDFVYVNSSETKEGDAGLEGVKEEEKEWGIVCIERLWTSGGTKMMYGNRYFRPDETYHLSTRRFLEKEVFKSDKHASLGLDEIVGKCCVVHVKQYFTMKPEGYDEKDVYVCESRYRTRSRTFKKIKIYPENPTIKLVPREVPLSAKRVISVFRERVEKHKDELQELEDLEKMVEKEKPNVMAYNNMDIDDGNTYYEQFNTVCSGVIKTGDYVYVVADGGKQVVAQIDSIWETKDGKCYFRGPWFISPSEVPHNPNRMFYKNEIFLSSLEDVSPIVSIIGRCHVLELNDWVIYRPTEIPECDVFICTSAYDEINRQLKRLPAGGLKKYTHSPLVTEDEIYFFKRALIPPKVSFQKSNKNKVVTGYILYSREVRKQVVQNNPESTFGDISRIVGSEWKSLPQTEKQHWEEKASKLNEETKALLLLEQEQCGSPAPAPPPPDQIFECLWDNCDYQFEEASDLIDHCIKDKDTHGHVQAFYQENAGADFNCHWRNCNRVKKNLQPFPSITRLIRHVRDMHINKGNGRSVAPENRSKNFKPSSKPPPARPTSSTSSSATPNATATSTFNTSNGIVSSNLTVSSTNVLSPNGQKPQEPMFVSVPPRPQRVLHSEAYIKYIEGLTTENKHLSQWERTLHASQENAPEPDSEKLKQVAQWLGRKTDQHDNVVAALWTLRNQLLKDTLSLHKTL